MNAYLLDTQASPWYYLLCPACLPFQLIFLLMVIQHPCPTPNCQKTNHHYVFQPGPASTSMTDFLIFFFFLFQENLFLAPTSLFFSVTIIHKFLTYKLKSDHDIVVLSKHAQDMQKLFNSRLCLL